MLDPWLEGKLNERRSKNLLRKLTTRHNLVDFTSNDYLGLAGSIELFKTIEQRAQQVVPISNGSAGSRLLSGNSEYAEGLEAKLAGIFHSESALIFNSGYAANVGVLSSIATKDSTIIYDELAHACIKDGARLSQAKRFSFKHNDINDLESKIKKSTGKIFLVVESIYSMDGDICPLNDVVALAEKYDANVVLDEAHSTGVFGKDGCGLAVSLQLHDKIVARIYTFGKAMGVHGACVAGSRLLQKYLVNFSRPFIYTTALPAHSLAAIECSFDYLAKNISLQQLLRDRIEVYLTNAGNLSNRTNSTSAIQTVLIDGNENAIQVAAQLQQRGYDVRPILSPTVPEGKERLRICLHAFNSEDEIKGLTEELKAISTQHSPL
jgi:8-amino-7-oxononanoate synthase